MNRNGSSEASLMQPALRKKLKAKKALQLLQKELYTILGNFVWMHGNFV